MSIFGIAKDIDQRTAGKFGPSRTFLTISTNIMVTGLIAFHLLRVRHHLRKVFPTQNMELYTGIVAILIESALPLSVFGIIYAVMGTVGLPNATAPGGRFMIAYYVVCTFFFSFCVSVLIIFVDQFTC